MAGSGACKSYCIQVMLAPCCEEYLAHADVVAWACRVFRLLARAANSATQLDDTGVVKVLELLLNSFCCESTWEAAGTVPSGIFSPCRCSCMGVPSFAYVVKLDASCMHKAAVAHAKCRMITFRVHALFKLERPVCAPHMSLTIHTTVFLMVCPLRGVHYCSTCLYRSTNTYTLTIL